MRNSVLFQLDGAVSFSSSSSYQSCSQSLSSSELSPLPDENTSWFSQHSLEEVFAPNPHQIPVQIGFRPWHKAPQQRSNMSNNVMIHRDNRFVHSLDLPTFTVYNMRSIWSKINNLAEDIEDRNVDISFLSEVWEKKESKRHQQGIENLLEMKGISYISTPRPGTKRGGETAVAANPGKFFLSKLNIEIPKPIEVVWGLLRP